VTAKDTGVFLTDAGEEISVRTIAHHTPTAITTLEPLYATDAELMDGARGELRGKTGGSLRGTLRRQGDAFALHPEQPQQKVLEKTEKTETTSPLASPPARRAKPTEKTPETTPSASPPARRAKRKEKAPEAAPVASPPRLRAEPSEQTPETAPSQAEAIEALKTIAQFLRADRSTVLETTSPVASEPPPSQAEAIEAERAVAQFLRGDGRVELELAKHAHAIVGEFIAERERQMTAHDD
jgi:hypothetical protein